MFKVMSKKQVVDEILAVTEFTREELEYEELGTLEGFHNIYVHDGDQNKMIRIEGEKEYLD